MNYFALGDSELGVSYYKEDEVAHYALYENNVCIDCGPITNSPYPLQVFLGLLNYWSIVTLSWTPIKSFWRINHYYGEGFTSLESARVAQEINSRYEHLNHTTITPCSLCHKYGLVPGLQPGFVCNSCQARQAQDSKARDIYTKCSVCKENQIKVTFQPCGHLVACFNCTMNITSTTNRCPTCQKPIALWLLINLE